MQNVLFFCISFIFCLKGISLIWGNNHDCPLPKHHCLQFNQFCHFAYWASETILIMIIINNGSQFLFGALQSKQITKTLLVRSYKVKEEKPMNTIFVDNLATQFFSN